MRAALLYGPHDVRLAHVPRPAPGAGEVLLRVQAVGLCGSDLHYYREGRIGPVGITSPLIPGHEFSAIVVENRSRTCDLAPGCLVAVDPARSCGSCEWCLGGHPNLCPATRFAGSPGCHGGLAEYHVAPAEAAVPVAAGMGAVPAALLEPLGVAIHALDLARLRPMETVAVLGAGPIGLLLMQVARASGAGRVFVVDPLEYRVEVGRRLGADEVATRADAIMDWTGGRGVDVVLEATNSPMAPAQAVAIARIGGRIILVGIPDGDTFALDAAAARRKGLVLKFARRMGRVYPRAVQMAQGGRVTLDALVTHRFPLDRTPEAFVRQNSYRDGVLKTMILVDADA